jgi:hypothetical protein
VDVLHPLAIVIPASQQGSAWGETVDPRMMTLILLSCAGIVCSSRNMRACYEDLGFRIFTANQQPNHGRTSEFCRQNLEALSGCSKPMLSWTSKSKS